MITQTNVQDASFFFTAYSVGNLLGAVITGLVYDKIRRSSLLLLLTLLGMGTMTVVLPWCSYYVAMIAAHFMLAVFAGGLDTG
jgi:MFS family permease